MMGIIEVVLAWFGGFFLLSMVAMVAWEYWICKKEQEELDAARETRDRRVEIARVSERNMMPHIMRLYKVEEALEFLQAHYGLLEMQVNLMDEASRRSNAKSAKSATRR